MALAPLDVFIARCQARALLWQAGELTLHQAVDELEVLGRKLRLDTDLAQARMAEAFGPLRDDLKHDDRKIDAYISAAEDHWNETGWIDAAIEYRSNHPPQADLSGAGSFEEACRLADAWQRSKPRDPELVRAREAPATTVEALMYQLREGGTAVLQEASVRRRLAQLSERQLTEVGSRLLWRQGGNIVRSWRKWKTKEVGKLLQQWTEFHE
jgi:hypothetical protein